MNQIFVDGHGMCEVWTLPKVSPKKQRRGKYIQGSFVHPAKMSVTLCRKIIEAYTETGETVLDPMSGIFTTGIEAAYLGRNAIGVELEDKFVNLSNQNIDLLEKAQTLTPKGKAVVIKGDSRELSRILGEKADKVIFSPPYRERYAYKNPEERQKDDPTASKRNRIHKPYSQDPNNIGNLKYGKPVDVVVTSPPFADSEGWKAKDYKEFVEVMRQRCKNGLVKGHYSTPEAELRHIRKAQEGARVSQENIGRLKYGKPVDAIVTSPPYIPDPKNLRHKSLEKWDEERGHKPDKSYRGTYGTIEEMDKKNISQIREHGSIDAIVTSPPFAEAQSGGGIAKHGYDGPKHTKTDLVGRRSYMPENVGDGEGNISRMPYGKVDAVITSPPYSGSEVGKGIRQKRWEKIKSRKGFKGRKEWKNGTPCHYSDNPENIGNLPHNKAPEGKETYLSAVFQVYRECHKTLKLGGKMVLVLKDFVRNKKVVRLDLDTKKLVEGCGFRWVETKLFRLPSKSFWRTLYDKKHPEVDTSLLKFEFVEVFEKPLEAYAGSGD